MEDNLMTMPTIIDKNSKEYDLSLLNEMIGMEIPINKFETEMKRIMRKKSSCKLWWDNKLVKIWDGTNYHEVNYRCCPSSHRARHIFGLVLEYGNESIKIKEGFLEAL